MSRKGGPGSGRKPEGGTKPKPLFSWKPNVPRSGQRPSVLYPMGRHPDGSPRTINDVRPASKPKR